MSGPKRVLLVDDDKTLQGLLAEQLETTREFSTLCVNDAAAALQAAPSEHFDLVLLDVGLPDMDGYELVGRLKKRSECQSTRFIALTGYGQTLDRLRSRVAGFDHHLVKPPESKALEELIAGLKGGMG